MIDYFSPDPTALEQTLRQIKGNHRREFVAHMARKEGIDSIPEAWKKHSISEPLKGMLQAQHPRARGGEDLPDLEAGEVEIARMTLADSVHGEVTSLRAQRVNGGPNIRLQLHDEYETQITLPYSSTSMALTAEEVIVLFRDAEPSPMDTSCKLEFQSFFYPNLNELAKQMSSK